MYTLGIDIGSTTSKAVILENGKKIVVHVVVPLGTGTVGPVRAPKFLSSPVSRASRLLIP